MDQNTQYWLKRVAVKIYKLFLAGVDFNTREHLWLFDWNDGISTEENLENVVAEDKALTLLTHMGVIKSVSKDNFYRSQQLEALADPLRGHSIWIDWENFNPAKREYDYLRIIDDLHWDEFLAFCEEHGVNFKEDKITATLEISNQVPIVHVADKTYTLKTLQSGSPYVIVQVAYDHADIRFGFKELRQWTQKTFEAQKRFTDIFRKNEFSKGKVLSPFVSITPTTFMLKKQALLTPLQLSVIQKNCTD